MLASMVPSALVNENQNQILYKPRADCLGRLFAAWNSGVGEFHTWNEPYPDGLVVGGRR